MNYLECPRCQNSWQFKINRYECINCNINYYLDLNNMIDLYGIIHENDRLTWIFKTKKCYYRYQIDSVYHFLNLPWLPFDITSDKLKTYLLFS